MSVLQNYRILKSGDSGPLITELLYARGGLQETGWFQSKSFELHMHSASIVPYVTLINFT